jgi:hypothetical protein
MAAQELTEFCKRKNVNSKLSDFYSLNRGNINTMKKRSATLCRLENTFFHLNLFKNIFLKTVMPKERS